MTDLPFDPVQLMRDYPEKMRIPGGLLSSGGPQDYVGAVPALSGVLFFQNAHELEVREAICACFDEYVAFAEGHLTWLWRAEPPVGPNKIAYSKAKPIRELMKQLSADHLVSFTYTSGQQAHDAGDWEFQVYGLQGWCAKMGDWGTSALRFAIPLLSLDDHPTVFQSMFVNFARRLRALHGYGGHALVLSAARPYDNDAFEAYLAGMLNGLDAGDLIQAAADADKGIKTVSWLTAINHGMLEEIGGISAVRSALPMDWFALYDYGEGLVIQAGPIPEGAPVDTDPKPSRLVLPNVLLAELRAPEMGLHVPSASDEPRLIGWAAQQWLKRYDIENSELLAYQTKLLKEPKLTEATTLRDRL